jgi:tripartite-type tricarboxylate transporter receptor subunit TctC
MSPPDPPSILPTCRSRRRWLAWGLLGLSGPWLGAAAGDWPTRPIRILLAYPPGGVSDQVARPLAQHLAEQLGVPVLVENRPGAGGALAIEALSRTDPDGHTLAFAAVTAVQLHANASPGAAPVVPVAGVMHTPVLVAGTPALEGSTLMEMLAQARARPGRIRWATTGEGTTGHLVLEQLSRASGTVMTHVPYKGGGQQVNDALGGHFEVLSTNVAAPQIEAIRAGRLKPLAVGSPARLPVLPEVPTLSELGFAQANLGSLFGLFAPPLTPPATVERLNAEVNAALRKETLRAQLLGINNTPAAGSAADFARQVARTPAR